MEGQGVRSNPLVNTLDKSDLAIRQKRVKNLVRYANKRTSNIRDPVPPSCPRKSKSTNKLLIKKTRRTKIPSKYQTSPKQKIELKNNNDDDVNCYNIMPIISIYFFIMIKTIVNHNDKNDNNKHQEAIAL